MPDYPDIKATLANLFRTVERYEPVETRASALKVIPRILLENNARKSSGQSETFRDFLLLELLQWFKYQFFTWVDRPKCVHCDGNTKSAGATGPTSQEIALGDASTVELYVCINCNQPTRFPRYNNPLFLLSWRKGRCGEWANCFALCCRALDYETRYVYDFTDHVWVEVYSESQSRWLHCDPCENLCDSPLVYEAGWGKKLSYIFGVSNLEIQDVTWRYIKNPRETLTRRNLVDEASLARYLLELSNIRQRNMTPEEKDKLLFRRIKELAEFFAPRDTLKESECIGRISGSAAWKLSRQEMGGKIEKRHIFYHDASHDKMVVRFSTARNEFETKGCSQASSFEKGTDWSTGVYICENIMYKQEFDWKMAYLARTIGSQHAKFSLRFEFSRRPKSVQIRCEVATFENGIIQWSCIVDDAQCSKHLGTGSINTSVECEKSLVLEAVLSGGKGENAWQHTQLFRQKMDSNEWPLEVQVEF